VTGDKVAPISEWPISERVGLSPSPVREAAVVTPALTGHRAYYAEIAPDCHLRHLSRRSVGSDDSFGRASGSLARFLNRSLGYLVGLGSLFAFVANVL
jgi:hypothetical protein